VQLGPHTQLPCTSASNALLLCSVPTRPTRVFAEPAALAGAVVGGAGDIAGAGTVSARCEATGTATGSGTAAGSGLAGTDEDGEDEDEGDEDGDGTRWSR